MWMKLDLMWKLSGTSCKRELHSISLHKTGVLIPPLENKHKGKATTFRGLEHWKRINDARGPDGEIPIPNDIPEHKAEDELSDLCFRSHWQAEGIQTAPVYGLFSGAGDTLGDLCLI